jgi:hypothetical protein
MTEMRTRLLTIGLVACAAVNAAAQPTFTVLGNGQLVTGGSGDASVLMSSTGNTISRWTQGTGWVDIGGSGTSGNPNVSRDGSTVIGTALNPLTNLSEIAIWQGGTSWNTLGHFPGGASSGSNATSGWGVNDNGSTVVGLGWVTAGAAHGISWTSATGVVNLGSSVAGRSSRANVASGSGSLIGGWQDSDTGFRQGAVWNNGVQSTINDSQMNAVGEVLFMNSAGTVMGGSGGASFGGGWIQGTNGQITRIGLLAGTTQLSTLFDAAADGSIGVGSSGSGFGRRGIVWTPGGGVVAIEDYFTSIGITLPTGSNLNSPTVISDDGSVFAGWGRIGTTSVSWMVVVPAPTSALPFALLGGLAARRRRR